MNIKKRIAAMLADIFNVVAIEKAQIVLDGSPAFTTIHAGRGPTSTLAHFYKAVADKSVTGDTTRILLFTPILDRVVEFADMTLSTSDTSRTKSALMSMSVDEAVVSPPDAVVIRSLVMWHMRND